MARQVTQAREVLSGRKAPVAPRDAASVLLLRPAGPGTGLGPLPIPPAQTGPGGQIVVRVYPAELADRAPAASSPASSRLTS